VRKPAKWNFCHYFGWVFRAAGSFLLLFACIIGACLLLNSVFSS
jgi:hypothetical protein